MPAYGLRQVEMGPGLFIERVRRQNGRQPTPEQVHRWATVNGYRAMGLADGGSLVAGNKADLIMIDLQRAHLTPVLRVVADYVHQGQGGDVEAVMVDGRWITDPNNQYVESNEFGELNNVVEVD